MEDFSPDLDLEHLLFVDRRCRKCLRTMTLLDNFYKTRKDRGENPSAYSYVCKECTIRRVTRQRKLQRKVRETDYPDW